MTDNEPTDTHVKNAGKDPLNDEMLPDRGRPQEQEKAGGDERDSAGRHGDMAPESARSLDKSAKD